MERRSEGSAFALGLLPGLAAFAFLIGCIGFDKRLASLDLILLEEQKQLDLKLAGGFVDTTEKKEPPPGEGPPLTLPQPPPFAFVPEVSP